MALQRNDEEVDSEPLRADGNGNPGADAIAGDVIAVGDAHGHARTWTRLKTEALGSRSRDEAVC
uniref:Uncharacterized protein n=1 Tax=Arundo donax TaxID=35708 RepID=A0A0A9AK76_ARUDO